MNDNPAGGEVTALLSAWARDDPGALDRLMPVIYDRMRRLGASFLRRERDDHTLQTTALIHEAFLRLVRQQHIEYRNREQFFANVGRMMRRVLIDHARSKQVQKRGGEAEHLAGEALDQVPAPEPALDIVAVDEALAELEAENPELARIVQLKFFIDLTVAEVAEVTGLGTATVQRRWRLARAWLFQRLGGSYALG